MESKKLEKNLIFYVPGQEGTVFTHKAGNLINDEIIDDTMDMLSEHVKGSIQFIEERRAKERPVA